MPTRTLTAAAVGRIKSPVEGQVDHFDRGYPGFALRVSYGGTRSWQFFYRQAGKPCRLTLGRWPGMELAEAREAWRVAREAVARGLDPAHAKPEVADSFATIFVEWLRRDQGDNRSRAAVQRLIERDVLPHWGSRPITDIGRRDVIELIDAVVDRGSPVMARRLHAHLHRLFRWSVGRGILSISPMQDLPKPGADIRRDRVLCDRELVLVWQAAGKTGWPFGPIVRLLVLTGARRNEIGDLRWGEISGGAIHLSGDRTKNGEPRTIPLSAPALAVIEGLPRTAGTEFAFSTNGARPVTGYGRAKLLLDRAIADLNGGEFLGEWRLHDVRRTCATGLQRLGVALQVTEQILGHISGSRAGVVGVYQKYEFAAEAKAALELWGRHVEDLLTPGASDNVVTLRVLA